MPKIALVIHNVRSAYNVGSLLRTADGFGVHKVYLSGFSPYPQIPNDPRLPHERLKITKLVRKTALGAEKSLDLEPVDDIIHLLKKLKSSYIIAALEQTDKAISLAHYKANQNVALIVGNELVGVEDEILGLCDIHLEIPMQGSKESFNVASAGAIALYHLSNK